MVTKTIDEVAQFLNVARAWLARTDGGTPPKPVNTNTKMAYALSRVMPRAEKIVERFQEGLRAAMEDADNDNCMVSTDDKDKGAILREPSSVPGQPGTLKFTPDGAKKRDKAVRDYLHREREKEVEIEPYHTTLVPKIPQEMSYAEAAALVGFVLKEVPEPVEAAAATGD